MYILCCASLSGGQGKTTACYFMARKLSEDGLRVLLIDGDPQANLTLYSGIELKANDPTLLEVLKEVIRPEEAIYEISLFNGEIIPADNGLIVAQDYLPSTGIPALVLRNLLTDETAPAGVDVVIIDSPPQGSHLWSTCICAADGILIPAEAGSKGVNSVETTLITLDTLKRRRKAFTGEILGILPFRDKWVGNTQTDRSKKGTIAMKKIAEEEGFSLYNSILESEQYKKAIDSGKTLAEIGHVDLETAFNQIAKDIKARIK
jgi:chromosome partitioning protein